MKRGLIPRAGALLAVVALLAGAGCSKPGPSNEGGFVAGSTGLTRVDPAQRQAAPVTSGIGLDHNQVTTAHPGQVVVVNVWGSWCAPCRKEAPDLQGAHEQTATVAQFVGIDTRDPDPAPAQAFQRTFQVTYPSIYDPKGESLIAFSGALPPSGIPSTLVIDRNGRIAARVIGPVDKTTLIGLVNDTAAGK